MRLYNATMRINRLEMLKARCGIRAMEGYRDTERLINDNLEERAYSEYSRLAGILGNSVQFNENMVRSIVNASYQNATWSQRLWVNQATLSARIGAQLAQGILTGKSSTVLAREIQKLTGGSTYACQRLMRTELRRVQTEAAMQSMSDNGVTEYKFIVANGVNPCEECLALDGQVFKLAEMAPGKNAPPVHPSCHCASAPHVDEKKWQRWLDGPAQAGVPWGEFEDGEIRISSRITQSGSRRQNGQTYGDRVNEHMFRNAHFKSPIDDEDYLDSVWNTATDTNITSSDVAYVRRNIHQISSKKNIGKVVTLSSMDYVYVIEMKDYLDYNILWKIPNDDNLNDAIARKRRRR
jgi:SPP1 gp7 family putative phage head morphogenesis protein